MRYDLIVLKRVGKEVAIRVFDRIRKCVLLDWQGAVVRHLLESGALPGEYRRSGCYTCDKSFIWHLILAGAATHMALEQIRCLESGLNNVLNKRLVSRPLKPVPPPKSQRLPLDSLSDRLIRLGVQVGGLHKRIARMIYAHPGHHFSVEDVRCLLLLDCPLLSDDRVPSCLAALTDASVIQCVKASGENIFYYAWPESAPE